MRNGQIGVRNGQTEVPNGREPGKVVGDFAKSKSRQVLFRCSSVSPRVSEKCLFIDLTSSEACGPAPGSQLAGEAGEGGRARPKVATASFECEMAAEVQNGQSDAGNSDRGAKRPNWPN